MGRVYDEPGFTLARTARSDAPRERGAEGAAACRKVVRKFRSPLACACAIYTRKSTEEGLEQEFNSLDAQREAAEAFILSQRREGWIALPDLYDDGGFTGANMDRPALTRGSRKLESKDGEVSMIEQMCSAGLE